MELLKRFCKELGGTLRLKRKYPVEEYVCILPANTTILAMTKSKDTVSFGAYIDGTHKEVSIDNVSEAIAYDVEKATLDMEPIIEFSKRVQKIAIEVLPDGTRRLFID